MSQRKAVVLTVLNDIDQNALKQLGFEPQGELVPLGGTNESAWSGTIPAQAVATITALKGVVSVAPNSDMELCQSTSTK